MVFRRCGTTRRRHVGAQRRQREGQEPAAAAELQNSFIWADGQTGRCSLVPLEHARQRDGAVPDLRARRGRRLGDLQRLGGAGQRVAEGAVVAARVALDLAAPVRRRDGRDLGSAFGCDAALEDGAHDDGIWLIWSSVVVGAQLQQRPMVMLASATVLATACWEQWVQVKGGLASACGRLKSTYAGERGPGAPAELQSAKSGRSAARAAGSFYRRSACFTLAASWAAAWLAAGNTLASPCAIFAGH